MKRVAFCILVASCGSSETYDPGVSPGEFQTTVTNPLFPLPVGARWVYAAETDEGTERTEVEVLGETKLVAFGVVATVVQDIEYLDDEKIEDTRDWFAQHADGSVWYFGEDTAEFEDGEIVSTAGSWEAGAGGGLPGMIMPAAPAVGQRFRQEFLPGEAEDMGEVVEIGVSVEVEAGSWTGCVKTRDTTPLDPSVLEFKYYCPNVGLVLTEEGDVRVELIELEGLPASP